MTVTAVEFWRRREVVCGQSLLEERGFAREVLGIVETT